MGKRRDWFDKATLATAIAGVLLIVMTTAISQYNVASSNRDTAIALKRLEALAIASRQQAHAAELQAEALRLQVTALNKSLGLNRQGLDLSRREVEIAHRSLVSSQVMGGRQTRPYLRLLADENPPIEIGKQLLEGFTVSNPSNYPAFRVIGAGLVIFARGPVDTLGIFKRLILKNAVGTLQPGVTNRFSYHSDTPFTADNLTALKAPTTKMYGLASVQYADASGQLHRSYVCAEYEYEEGKWSASPCIAPDDD